MIITRFSYIINIIQENDWKEEPAYLGNTAGVSRVWHWNPSEANYFINNGCLHAGVRDL